jgi:HlyD family secretion protein
MKRLAFVLFWLAVVSLAFGLPAVVEAAGTANVAKAQLIAEEDEPTEAGKEADKNAEQSAASKENESEDPAATEDAKTDAGDEEKKENEKAAEEKEAAKPDEKAEAKAEAKKRKTHKVESKRLKIDLTLDGTFVAEKMQEVALRPETWSEYEIVEVIGHGEKVRKGETLIKFDDEKINEAITDLELEQRLNDLAIMRAEEELPRMEKTLKLDFEDAERLHEQAREDFERYREIERPMSVKTANFMVKYYEFMLSYEKDELDQLQKMYDADELTEETEEIVLKRQRNSVEFAEFSLENARLSRDLTLNVRLPRSDIRIKEALERTGLALARAQTALAIDLNRARYELEQRKKARTKSLDRHAKLLKDRDLMKIKAPADGIVFYGQHTNGRWAETQSLINKYKPHSKLSPGSTLMTVVETRPVYVTSTFDEGKRPDMKDDQKVRVRLPAEGSDRIDGEVKSISTIPISPGKFEASFDLQQDALPDWIVPGMSCKVQVTTYDKKDAIVVPKAAVQDDEDDEDQKFVWVVKPDDEDAKPERRDVKLGKTKGDELEITDGLKNGEVVSLEDESDKAKKES